MKDINLSGLLAGEYCQSCKSHRLSLTDDLMISCKDCCEEHSFAPILLVEYQTVCRDLSHVKMSQIKLNQSRSRPMNEYKYKNNWVDRHIFMTIVLAMASFFWMVSTGTMFFDCGRYGEPCKRTLLEVFVLQWEWVEQIAGRLW